MFWGWNFFSDFTPLCILLSLKGLFLDVACCWYIFKSTKSVYNRYCVRMFEAWFFNLQFKLVYNFTLKLLFCFQNKSKHTSSAFKVIKKFFCQKWIICFFFSCTFQNNLEQCEFWFFLQCAAVNSYLWCLWMKSKQKQYSGCRSAGLYIFIHEWLNLTPIWPQFAHEWALQVKD